jgi:hypothetical protein
MRYRIAPWALCLVATACSSGPRSEGPSQTAEDALDVQSARSVDGEPAVDDALGRPTRGPLAATRRVLLISVDGMLQVDLDNWIASHPASTLAHLAARGVEYDTARTTTPSDSFPGMLALATGGTPKSTGVYYDDSYDRTLYPPGQGCTGKPGTEAIFDESVDHDSTRLFSGGINPANLPHELDARGQCKVVYPRSASRNTYVRNAPFRSIAIPFRGPLDRAIARRPSPGCVTQLRLERQNATLANAPRAAGHRGFMSRPSSRVASARRLTAA